MPLLLVPHSLCSILHIQPCCIFSESTCLIRSWWYVPNSRPLFPNRHSRAWSPPTNAGLDYPGTGDPSGTLHGSLRGVECGGLTCCPRNCHCQSYYRNWMNDRNSFAPLEYLPPTSESFTAFLYYPTALQFLSDALFL